MRDSKQFSRKTSLLGLALGAVFLVQACGGSDNAGEQVTPPNVVTAFEGVAAVGMPLVGAAVELVCAQGKPAATVTDAKGAWATSGSNITLPCAVEVSGGNLGSSAGRANLQRLHAPALAAGLNNVTSLTTLKTALLAGQDPALWFAGLQANPAALTALTPTASDNALASLKTMLAGLPNPLELPAGFHPVTSKFEASAADPFDQLLEQLNTALAANGVSLSEVLANLAADRPALGQTPAGLTLSRLSSFGSGIEGGSEIPAYDPLTKRLFVVNGSGVGSVEVWNIANPASPVKVTQLEVTQFGSSLGGFNSVAVQDGIVALAIASDPKTSNGYAVFLKSDDLSEISRVEVGALPDMVTFTPDGRYALVANEGEPDSYNDAEGVPSIDPEGSISVIDISDIRNPVERKAGFASFNGQEEVLRARGIRIYGPNASVAQDMEPEYITVSADSKTAYVTLQENNAIAVVNIANAAVTALHPLGYKDHGVAGAGMDVSNEDGGSNTNSGSPAINIQPVPVRGLYLPDAIASYTVAGTTFLVTANEGDARADWPGFNEEARVREYCRDIGMDLSVFGPDGDLLTFDSNLGRLRITTSPNGGENGKNDSGQCNVLYAYGARSFSIWNGSTGAQVFDSGDDFEVITAKLAGNPGYDFQFNSGHDDDALDARSPNKGPEPEGVVVQRFGDKVYAFIGLERVGGVMVYDVTNPAAASYVTYVNSRNGLSGDRGAEGLVVIPAAASPTGKPLLAVGNEISGTTALFSIDLTY